VTVVGSAEWTTAAGSATAGIDYAQRLTALEFTSWKQRLDVQRPYRWHLRRLHLGRVLDVGCGIGRNLAHLDGNGVGVDHNADSVTVARQRGFTAYTTEEFPRSGHARPDAFDSLLLSHLAEHVSRPVLLDIVGGYLPYLRDAGRVVFVCPQERGWATDATHVRFVDFADLRETCALLDLRVEKQYSFPFLRPMGKVFPYNEFVVVARRS
jgi:SAM-dependent methyltransferase